MQYYEFDLDLTNHRLVNAQVDLPTATMEVKGGVKIGIGLKVAEDGTLSTYSPIDLSMQDVHGFGLPSRNTANCYVVKVQGEYGIPLVYGNAIKNGVANSAAYTKNNASTSADFVNYLNNPITSPYIETDTGVKVASAEVGWSEVENLITNVSVKGGFIYFSVNEIPSTNANAIIVIKDIDGAIMWSWHIWVCTDDLHPVTFINATGVDYDLLPISLGWTWDTEDKLKGKNVFYQWGRKDPISGPAAYNTNTYRTVYGDLQPVYNNPSFDYVADAIKNPNKFALYNTTNYNWVNATNVPTFYNYWDANVTTTGANDNQDTAIKTVYDPSPVGFMVPVGRFMTGFSNVNTSTVGSFSNGWNVKTNPNDTVGHFVGASGYCNYYSGSLSNVGSYGLYWSSAADSPYSAYCLYFYSSYVNPLSYNYRSSGFSVLPCRDCSLNLF